MTQATADHPSPSYRRIMLPMMKRRGVYLVVLACGILVSWAAGCVLVALLVDLTLGMDHVGDIGRVATLILAAFAPILWICAWPAWYAKRMLAKTKNRSRRLERIARRQDSRARVPHRLVERALRTGSTPIFNAARLMSTLPPGQTIVVHASTWRRFYFASSSIAFEPARVGFDSDEAIAIYNLSVMADAARSKEPVNETWKPRIRKEPSLFQRIRGPAFAAVFLLWFWPFGSFTPVVVLAAGAWPLWQLVWRRQLWIVPGGLALRELRPWWRRPRVQLLTPQNASLLLDLRYGYGYVVFDGRRCRFGAALVCRTAVVAGWISAARTPTLEEVRSLLDPEGDHAGGTSEAPPTRRAE